jgi:hypothetical protein
MRVEVIDMQDLEERAEVQPPSVSADVDHPADDALPLGRLAGLLGSGTFAFTTSLTCFVC